MSQSGLSQDQLDALHRALADRRQSLNRYLASEQKAAEPVTLDQQSVGRVSRIDAIQQQQMAIASREQAQQTLSMIESALARMAEGEYGLCLQCAETIRFERLQVQPFATLCIDCQSKAETR